VSATVLYMSMSLDGFIAIEHLSPEHIELERTRVIEGASGVTHMHYRVQR
jgi:hypothetical protein